MVGLGQEGFAWGGGGAVCLKYLKRGGTEKRGEDTKILKRGRGSSWVKWWVCQHPSHPIFYGICAA